ncbi:hypothetical protein D3C80_1866930 [compost metagenome]
MAGVLGRDPQQGPAFRLNHGHPGEGQAAHAVRHGLNEVLADPDHGVAKASTGYGCDKGAVEATATFQDHIAELKVIRIEQLDIRRGCTGGGELAHASRLFKMEKA